MESILGNTRKPDVIFHASGKIDITSSVASRLRLCAGDVIDILADDGEYYLYVKFHPAKGRHKGMVHRSNGKGNHYRASSVKLCRLMLKECGTENIARLMTGEVLEHERYGNLLPIITKHPLI